jgi:hypothetical protein
MAGCAAVVTGLLASWFAWSLAVYGMKITLGSNTAVTDSRQLSLAGNLVKIGHNLICTLVPYPLWRPMSDFQTWCDQPNAFGFVRDYFFLLYQQNLMLALGAAGGMAAVILLVRQLRRTDRPQSRFWMNVVGVGGGLGIAIHGGRVVHGVAHVGLQPLIVMGLTLLAAGFLRLPRWLRCAVALALVADTALGILLHFRMQMNIFPLTAVSGGGTIIALSPGLLNITAIKNYLSGQCDGVVFWGDHFRALGWMLALAAVVWLGAAVLVLATTAWTGRIEPIFRIPPPFAQLVLVLYLLAATFCFSDRLMGYRINPIPPAGVCPSPTEAMRLIEPAYLAAKASPHDSRLQYDLGAVLYGLGKRDAEPCFNEALMLDPDNWRARYALRLLVTTHGRTLPEGEAQYAEAVRLNPTDGDAQSRLATILYRHGHKEQARERLMDAASAHPKSWELKDRLAVLLFEMGRLDEAIVQSRLALALKPDETLLVQRLRAMLTAQGMTPAAIDRTIAEVDGGDPARDRK